MVSGLFTGYGFAKLDIPDAFFHEQLAYRDGLWVPVASGFLFALITKEHIEVYKIQVLNGFTRKFSHILLPFQFAVDMVTGFGNGQFFHDFRVWFVLVLDNLVIASLTNSNSVGAVMSQDYYPFGLPWA